MKLAPSSAVGAGAREDHVAPAPLDPALAVAARAGHRTIGDRAAALAGGTGVVADEVHPPPRALERFLEAAFGQGRRGPAPSLAAVVGGAPLGIGEDLEGLGHDAKTLGGHRIARVQGRVQPPGALLEGAADLHRDRGPAHAQDLVEVRH